VSIFYLNRKARALGDVKIRPGVTFQNGKTGLESGHEVDLLKAAAFARKVVERRLFPDAERHLPEVRPVQNVQVTE
jgi:hypothetical protein